MNIIQMFTIFLALFWSLLTLEEVSVPLGAKCSTMVTHANSLFFTDSFQIFGECKIKADKGQFTLIFTDVVSSPE